MVSVPRHDGDEVYSPDPSSDPDPEAAEKLRLFLESPYIQWVDADRLIMRSAVDLVRAHAIRPFDAIHLATALRTGADTFYTHDRRVLERVSRDDIDVSLPPASGRLSI